MLDIEPDAVRDVDADDMLGAALGLPKQLQAALDAPAVEGLPRRPAKVLVTGMGGSAIGGSYLAAWADAESDVPVVVNRGYAVPAWVDADTLVVAASYSGNTEETLSAFVDARDKGAMLAAVTTGGKLRDYAERSSAPVVDVVGGLQPRAALGHMLSAGARVLDAAGCLDARPGLEAAVKELADVTPDLAADVPPPRNEAKRVALALDGQVPAVYAAGGLAPAATRFANQVHENAETLAWAAEMPEMNHNELVGWSRAVAAEGVTAVFLRDVDEPQAMRVRWDTTAEIVTAQDASVVQLEARGSHVLARQLSLTHVLDVASVYMAVLRGVDPTPVPPISDLKARVGKVGVVEGLDARMEES